MIGEPDAGKPHVRFDEGVQETSKIAARLSPTLPGPQIKKSQQYLVVSLWRCVSDVELWRGRESSKVPHATDRRDGRSSSISDFKQQKFGARASQPEKKKSPRLQPEA